MDKTANDVNNILDAIASPTRSEILRLLSKREMGYSELMASLGLEKNKDAGKFSYHLKKMLNVSLIEVDKDSGKYKLSRIGLTMLEILEELRKALGSRDLMIVRRSDNLVEPFDKSKIARSLVREANISLKLASEIASIAEEKLKDLKIEYLTSSLIRELVNNILLDMGLEKYRHRLTRIGMPIYDVSKTLKNISNTGDLREFIEKSSESIMKEYCLQSLLPRNIAEMHLSGEIDLYPLEGWLTCILARSYHAPSDVEESLEIISDISSYIINIKHELNIRVGGKEEFENTFKMIKHVFHAGLLRRRYFSITISIEDLLENYEKMIDFVKRIDGSEDKIKFTVVLDNLKHQDLQKLSEVFKNFNHEYAVANSPDILYSGFKLPPRENPSDIHAIFTINVLSLALVSGKDIEYIMRRVRELTMHGLTALSRRTKFFKQIYGRRYLGEIAYTSSLYGVLDAARTVYEAGPQASKESYNFINEVLRIFKDSLKKDSSLIGKISLSSRTARSSARRMLKSTYRRLGLKEPKDISDYSFLVYPPMEKFKNIEERASLESEIASQIDGGYISIVKNLRKRKILDEAIVLFRYLSETGNPFIIRFED
ncbi:MAG: ATP cone domain-containing protein [Candidatus Caldarchaeales archaeon]